jgi:dUTP diphosphatase
MAAERASGEAVPAGALGRLSLSRLLASPEPIVEACRDVEAQLQPNGIDLTVETVWRLAGPGALGGPGSGRRLPAREVVEPTDDGWYHLASGSYVVLLHERVRIPRTIMALARPRSTLLRCGGMLHTAVFDAGYRGQPEVLLVVANRWGIEVARDAAICQLVFFTLTEEVDGYRGAYQGR